MRVESNKRPSELHSASNFFMVLKENTSAGLNTQGSDSPFRNPEDPQPLIVQGYHWKNRELGHLPKVLFYFAETLMINSQKKVLGTPGKTLRLGWLPK